MPVVEPSSKSAVANELEKYIWYGQGVVDDDDDEIYYLEFERSDETEIRTSAEVAQGIYINY